MKSIVKIVTKIILIFKYYIAYKCLQTTSGFYSFEIRGPIIQLVFCYSYFLWLKNTSK